MMYPYSSYSYTTYGGQATFLVIAVLAAIILGVVLYFTFLSKKNEGKFKGATEKVYNFLSFNKFYTEDILKLLYIVSAAVLTVLGLVLLFTQSFLAGLLTLVIGNVVLRISYELIMMFIILCRKTVSVDKKLDKITEFYGDNFGDEEFVCGDLDDEEPECGGECCSGCGEPCGEQEPEPADTEEDIKASDR